MGSSSFLKIVAENFDVLAGPVVALVYPLYASVKAIESPSRVDDQQWLTYWVLYSLITLFELTFAKVIAWFPLWSYVKLIATCWLVLPYFSGAAYVYEHFVRPVFMNPQAVNILYIPQKKNIFTRPDDFLAAVEKYIEENGQEEFEKLISKCLSMAGSYTLTVHSALAKVCALPLFDDPHRLTMQGPKGTASRSLMRIIDIDPILTHQQVYQVNLKTHDTITLLVAVFVLRRK